MAESSYWADNYVEKKRTAQEAMRLIRPGQRVFIGSSCGEPQHLVKALSEASGRFRDIEIVRLFSQESTPLTPIADKTMTQSMNIRSFYLGSAKPERLASNVRFMTPINLSAVPRLFKSRQLPIHVALIQVSPPDDFGWMSLGVSVDITMAAAMSADLVIAQVNSMMPRVLGRSFIHVNDVDVIVEHDEDLLTVEELPDVEFADTIGRLIARLIDDASTIHMSPGSAQQGTFLALSGKNDLGVHTESVTSGLMRLVSMGVVTNRKKGLNEGKLVAGSAMGTADLYEFINDNPSIEFHPTDYVNDPRVIAGHNRMVSICIATTIDLTGQVAADAFSYNNFSGVTGVLDFVRGAVWSEGGKSIMIVPSTVLQDEKSRIVPMLTDTAVVVPRGDIQYVVSEYGVVNLFGKSIQERAMAMISIAHPGLRDELFYQAKEMGLLGRERSLSESIHGVYPVQLEENIEIDGQLVTVRPAKPVDVRRIQEHFYNLEQEDVYSRFFSNKTSFVQDEVEGVSQVDYVKVLTIVVVIGEIGFGRVVGIGEYHLVEEKNMAEIAFSVSKDWQRKGVGRILLRKLHEAARENGIAGFYAYTSPDNQGMIGLFKWLPYRIETIIDEGTLELVCRFDEPA